MQLLYVICLQLWLSSWQKNKDQPKGIKKVFKVTQIFFLTEDKTHPEQPSE